MLQTEQLELLHELGYDALRIFDAFCREHGLTYYLRGGSALGAVKYHGFVPWDDDIDVALPREDYSRLIQIFPPESGDYRFVSAQNSPRAYCYFPRIVLAEEKRRAAGLPRNHEYGTLLIDILPLDGVPDNPLLFRAETVLIRFLRLLSSVWTLESKVIPCKRRGLKKLIPEAMHFLKLHRLYSQKSIFRMMDRIYGHSPFGSTRFAGILAGSKADREIVPTQWWGKARRSFFGPLTCPVPRCCDRYLQRLFGENYMREEPERDTVEAASHYAADD